MNLSINPNTYNNTGSINAGEAVQRTESSGENLVLTRNVINVKSGDIFSGQVVGMSDDGVISLLIGGKDTINARLSQELNITMGQNMSFQVRNTSGKQISITPLYENLDNNPAAGKALDEAGLPRTAENFEMVNTMMKNGMSIDSASLHEMSRNLSMIQNGSPASVVQMTKLEIPVNEENVEQFEAYKAGQYEIAESMEGIAGDLSDLVSLNEGGGEILNIIAGEVPENVKLLLKEEIKLSDTDAAEVSEEEAQVNGKTAEKSQTPEILENAKEAPPAAEDGLKDTGIKTAGNEAAAKEVTKEAITGKVTEDLRNLLGDEGVKKLSEDLKNAGMPKSITDSVAKGELSVKDTLNLIRAGLKEESLKEDLTPLTQGREYKALVKNELLSNFLLDPKDVADKEKVKDYYQKLTENTQKLINSLNAHNSPQSTALADKLTNLKNNLNFMNDLNQAMTYIQLPLKMNEKNAHGDLYVYTKRKSLAKKDGNVSALLHLDMQTLGTMDIHVSMSPDMAVKTHFIMQKEEMLDFIAAHLDELNESLGKRGYKISADVALNNEAKSVPEIMFDRGTDIRLVQKTAFDVRA